MTRVLWILVVVLVLGLGYGVYWHGQSQQQAEAGWRDERESLQSQLANLQQSLRDLTQQLEAERQSSTGADNQRQAMQTQLLESQQRLAATQAELVALQQAHALLEQSLQSAISERDQAHQQAEAAAAELLAVQTQLQSVTQQLEQLGGRLQQTEAELVAQQQEQQRFERLQSALQTELKNKTVQIEHMQNQATVIRMGSDIVFDVGSTELNAEGKKALRLIAEALNEYPRRQIQIEGHTDDVQISSGLQAVYPSNWELSAARAARAVRFLQSLGVEPGRMRALGYGEYHPLTDNLSDQQRARNRRIEIALLPAAS